MATSMKLVEIEYAAKLKKKEKYKNYTNSEKQVLSIFNCVRIFQMRCLAEKIKMVFTM